MNRKPIISFMAVALASMAAFATAPKLPQKEVNFLRNAWITHTAEIELGKVAQEKGQTEFVRKFGEVMEKDHMVAREELVQRAKATMVTLPKTVDAKHQKVMDKLNAAQGLEFDKLYKAEMLKGHKKAYADFSKMASSATNTNVRNYASKYAPIVKMHLTMLKTGKIGM